MLGYNHSYTLHPLHRSSRVMTRLRNQICLTYDEQIVMALSLKRFLFGRHYGVLEFLYEFS